MAWLPAFEALVFGLRSSWTLLLISKLYSQLLPVECLAIHLLHSFFCLFQVVIRLKNHALTDKMRIYDKAVTFLHWCLFDFPILPEMLLQVFLIHLVRNPSNIYLIFFWRHVYPFHFQLFRFQNQTLILIVYSQQTRRYNVRYVHINANLTWIPSTSSSIQWSTHRLLFVAP